MTKLTEEERESVLEELAMSPAARRELALSSPVFFDTYYCGMRYAAHRERWLVQIVDLYMEAQESLESGAPKIVKLLLEAPRKHGKTELLITLIVMLICADRDIRILYVCDKLENAIERLDRVKSLLLSEEVQADWCSAPEDGYGPFFPATKGADDGTKKNARAITVLRDSTSAFPTVRASGPSGLTGGHYHVVIVDDIEDEESAASPTERRKTRAILGNTIGPMVMPGGLEVFIATRKHHDDCAGHLEKDPTWRKIVEKAIIRGNPDHAKPIVKRGADGRDALVGWDYNAGDFDVLWPEERPLEWLLTQRISEEMGPTGFAREFQNEVIDDGQAQFRMTWLEGAKTLGARISLAGADPKRPGGGPFPERMLVVQGCDPAFTVDKRKAEQGDRDWSVIVTLGACVETRQRYLMHVHRERGDSKAEKKRNIIRTYRTFAPPVDATNLDLGSFVANRWVYSVAMEMNNAGAFLSMEVTDDADVPIYQFQNKKGALEPFSGVPVMAPLFELGKYTFPSADYASRMVVDELVTELHGLGVAPHDDIACALWIAELRLRQVLATWEQHVATEAEFARLGVQRIR
ncbi:MAG: hypothetical protein AB7U23_13145 [Dehalococcoidia bacterium]